jgi:hypothetical protein
LKRGPVGIQFLELKQKKGNFFSFAIKINEKTYRIGNHENSLDISL